MQEVVRLAVTEQGPSLKILLVDDSADNRLLFLAYLKTTRYQTGSYDAVFMDMQMPIMDGYTATAAIRRWERENGRSPTPIIALAAYALKEDIKKALDVGCTAHLTKPLKKAILIEAIANCARKVVP